MEEHDDLSLVRRSLSGDHKAFEEIIDRYQKPLYNVALRMVGDLDDAADLTQTVFIKAFEKLNSYKERYKFFSWLYRIAVNTAINFLEQQKRMELLGDRDVAEEPEVDEILATSDRNQMLGNALLQLRPDYRIIILLKHFHELSYEEIGFVLEIPEKTVKSRLFAARGMLREILARTGLME